GGIRSFVDDARSLDHLDRFGINQLESMEGNVEGVASHVAQCASAIVEPAAPTKWSIGGTVGNVLGGAEKLIPVDVVRNPWIGLWPGHALRPDRAVGPAMNFADRSEHAVANNLNTLTESIFRRPLIPHLGRKFFGRRQLAHHTGFFDGP